MTTIRDLLAEVLNEGNAAVAAAVPKPKQQALYFTSWRHGVAQADALLARPELAAIIDLAAWINLDADAHPFQQPPLPQWIRDRSPEVRALLADWRASRAEQKPTPLTPDPELFCPPIEFVSYTTMNNALDGLAVDVSFQDYPDAVGVWVSIRPSPNSGEEMFELRDVITDKLILRTFVETVTKVRVP